MFLFFQKILPKHLLSRLLGFLAHCRCKTFKNTAIRIFMHYYPINLSEAQISDIHQFPSFNDFFIRRLKQGARVLPDDTTAVICPADGNISEIGNIHAGRLLQAKGQHYSLIDLLGGDLELAQNFMEGNFATIYLAPKDYHRVHMPVAGRLQQMIYIPGQLFSVNFTAANHIPQLFSRNERVVCIFQTEIGLMAVILVGAMLIGSVVTSWQGQVMPSSGRKPFKTNYENSNIHLQRGEELGYFQWGSTAIVLFAPGNVNWQDFQSGDAVLMGQTIGLSVFNNDMHERNIALVDGLTNNEQRY